MDAQTAAKSYEEEFGGRTLGFLAYQASWYIMPLALLGGTSVSYVSRSARKNWFKKRTTRGPVLRDVDAEDRARDNKRFRLALLSGLVSVVALVALVPGLFDFLAAGIASTRWGSSLLYYDGLLWIDSALKPGFYHAADALSFLSTRFLSRGPGQVAGGLMSIGSLVAIGMYSALRWFGAMGRDLGYSVAGVPVPRGRECNHFLFTGSPGAGKSTAIKALLDQVRARGLRAIVYDLNGEYTERYYRPGRDHILNPLDPRSRRWTPWAEGTTRADFVALARSLFPPDAKERFWADASSTLFASTLEALGREDRTTNASIHHALTEASVPELYQFLLKTPAARFLAPEAGAMPQNLLATVTSRLEAWTVLKDPEKNETPFSIRSYVTSAQDDSWLFLTSREEQAALTRPLLSLWADLVATSVLSLDEAREARLFAVFDEIASLQRLPALPGLLERGRKHGAAVVLGLQAMPQLRDAYGPDAAAALAAQPQTWLVLRSVEPDTARWLENALGQVEVEETHSSVSTGRGGEMIGYQGSAVTRPLVMAAEIASLPDHTGYLKLPGTREVYRVFSRPWQRRGDR
jgi:hypothetical protein